MNEARRINIMEDVAITLRPCVKKLQSVGHERLARIVEAIAVRLKNKVDEYDNEPKSAEIIIFPGDSDV